MNSTHSRSAVPIVLTVLNDKKKNSTVIAFNVNGIHESSEMLEHELHKLGITAIGRKSFPSFMDLLQVLCNTKKQEIMITFMVVIGIRRHDSFWVNSTIQVIPLWCTKRDNYV